MTEPLKCHFLSPQQRRAVIRENILKTTYKGLADLCGVTTRTIKRDITEWRQEGGLEEVLMDEFFHTYPKIQETYPDKAFDRLCYLLGKHITQKLESKETIKVEEKHVTIIADYTAAINAAAQHDIQSIRAKQQMDTPPTNNETS